MGRGMEHYFGAVAIEDFEHSCSIGDINQCLHARFGDRGGGVMEVRLIVVKKYQQVWFEARYLAAYL
jgi:hypothetical protein